MKKKRKKSKGRSAASYAAPIIKEQDNALRVIAIAATLSDMITETGVLAKDVESAEQYIVVIDQMNRKWSKMRDILLKRDIDLTPAHWYLKALFEVAPGVTELIALMATRALKGDDDGRST